MAVTVRATSDIDGLLEHLAAEEKRLREYAEYELADLHVSWIAAVEELVTFKTNHSGSRGPDVSDLYEEPADGNQTEC